MRWDWIWNWKLELGPRNWEPELGFGTGNWSSKLGIGFWNLKLVNLVCGLGLRTWDRELVLESGNWNWESEQKIDNWNWEIQTGNKTCELVLNLELVTFHRELGLKWDLVLELELGTGILISELASSTGNQNWELELGS